MSIYNTHKPPATEGGLYLKIEDGQSVKLRIASEPVIYESLFERGGEKNLSTRYGWIVWNYETNSAQILQMGVRFFRAIAALAQDEEWGDPLEYDIKITRQGTGTDTVYTVMPSSNRASLPTQATQAVNNINLVEKINAAPSTQRVMTLSQWDEMAAEAGQGDHAKGIEDLTAAGDAKRGIDKARETAEGIKARQLDTVVDVDPSEPVNLDDIPF